MRLLPADSLVIPPNRQRRLFDPALLSELAASISTNQLLNPITTRSSPEGVVLVAGERRVRAIRDYLWATGETLRFEGADIPEGMIPCVDLGELDPLAAEEAELEENIRRTDLSWQERATATARLAALRNAQAEARGEPPVPTAAIAKEVRGSSEGSYHTQTRDEIILAKHLDDPEVRAAKSAGEGMKVLRRKETAARNTALAETVGRSLSSKSHKLLNEDAVVWLAACPEGQFDVILTDPPYGVNADEFGDSAGKAVGPHSYKDDEASFMDTHGALVREALRVAKAQSHLYIFCDVDRFRWLRDSFEASGWWVHRTPLIWHKSEGRIPWPEHGPKRTYELILYAVKGKRPTTRIGSPDVISIPADKNLGHQAQKPVALYTELLRRSVKPGDTVLDPFAGTGPILPAAHGLKCYATAIEKDLTSYGIAVGRLKGLDAQDDLLDAV